MTRTSMIESESSEVCGALSGAVLIQPQMENVQARDYRVPLYAL